MSNYHIMEINLRQENKITKKSQKNTCSRTLSIGAGAGAKLMETSGAYSEAPFFIEGYGQPPGNEVGRHRRQKQEERQLFR